MPFVSKLNDTTSCTTIHDLCYDALRKVFTHFTAFELSNMADVCSKFRNIAQAEIWSQYKAKNLEMDIKITSTNQDAQEGKVDEETTLVRFGQVLPVLRNLGFVTSHLSIETDLAETHIPQKLMKSIVQYCSETLNNLELCAVIDFKENANSFKQLTALESLRLSCKDQIISAVIIELAAARIPLQRLYLSDFIADEQLVNGISELKGLQILILECKEIEMSDISKIVRNLGELTTMALQIDDASTDLALEIMEITEGAPKLVNFMFQRSDHTFKACLCICRD